MALWNLTEEVRAGEKAQEISQQVKSRLEAYDEKADAAEKPRPAYLDAPTIPMPTVTVDGNEYIGTLQIPDLKLELPIFSQWSYPNLKQAPCRYSGSAYMDDMILLAHDYKRHFGVIKSLSMGAQLTFTDAEDNRFVYQAREAQILDDEAIEEIKQGDWDLTLFTCTRSGTARYVLRCERVE